MAATINIMTVGGKIEPSKAVSTPGPPPAAKPTNIASFNASLPGTRFEKPTASTNCASVMILPTASSYSRPTEAGPDGDNRLTFRNIHKRRSQIDSFGSFMKKGIFPIVQQVK